LANFIGHADYPGPVRKPPPAQQSAEGAPELVASARRRLSN